MMISPHATKFGTHRYDGDSDSSDDTSLSGPVAPYITSRDENPSLPKDSAETIGIERHIDQTVTTGAITPSSSSSEMVTKPDTAKEKYTTGKPIRIRISARILND